MAAGDLVFTAKGRWTKVTAISGVEGKGTVYNFEVAENHDYFVGQSGILVHNVSCKYGNEIHQRFQDVLAEQTGTLPGGLGDGNKPRADRRRCNLYRTG